MGTQCLSEEPREDWLLYLPTAFRAPASPTATFEEAGTLAAPRYSKQQPVAPVLRWETCSLLEERETCSLLEEKPALGAENNGCRASSMVAGLPLCQGLSWRVSHGAFSTQHWARWGSRRQAACQEAMGIISSTETVSGILVLIVRPRVSQSTS